MGFWKTKSSAAILVNGERVSIVLSRDKRVDFVNTVHVSWEDSSKAIQIIQLLLPRKYHQTRDIILVLPRALFFSKQIRLPSVEADELRKMVDLQINQLLPYPAEGAVWDLVISQRRGSASDVLIFSIQIEQVMKYLKVFASAGLTPTAVTMSSSAVASMIGLDDSASVKVVFLQEERESEFCFCASGYFYFSRGILLGQKDLSAEQSKDFFAQVHLTFESHRKNFQSQVLSTGYYLAWANSRFPQNFWEMMSQESGISWKALPVDHIARPRILPSGVPEADILMGSALLQKGMFQLCDFLPQEYRLRSQVRALKQRMAVIVILLVGVFAALTAMICAPVIKKQNILGQLSREMKKIEGPLLIKKRESDLRSAIRATMAQRVSSLQFIEQLYEILPAGVSFSRIQISAMDGLELEGQALQSSSVNDVQDKMIASGMFMNVRLERAFRRMGPFGERMNFTISAKIKR